VGVAVVSDMGGIGCSTGETGGIEGEPLGRGAKVGVGRGVRVGVRAGEDVWIGVEEGEVWVGEKVGVGGGVRIGVGEGVKVGVGGGVRIGVRGGVLVGVAGEAVAEVEEPGGVKGETGVLDVGGGIPRTGPSRRAMGTSCGEVEVVEVVATVVEVVEAEESVGVGLREEEELRKGGGLLGEGVGGSGRGGDVVVVAEGDEGGEGIVEAVTVASRSAIPADRVLLFLLFLLLVLLLLLVVVLL
jgi:hypothetical protein